MAGTTLGTAYVQIVPSARGIQGSLQKAVGGEADAAGIKAGSSMAGRIKGALLKAGIGVAIGAGIKKSIEEGAKLEQSIGGIQTLFKDSADDMIKNANRAYKTAGISANKYMEQATSFSASLLQSTGGDTQKAAKAADQAIIDMSDNANKMGSNITDIQNAYQGFAKQNYTMLDNLKLGYGGTKTEMERLLADASKISGQKYDISNLSDVYEAIHVMQGELGITGTTAEEAASTLSGSFASMKAAADNFLGSLAIGQNVGPAMAGLAQSAATFLFKNLMPALGNIFKSLPTAIGTFISTGLPIVKQAGMDLINSITGGADAAQFGDKIGQIIIKNAPKVISGIGSLLQTLLGYLGKAAGALLKAGAALVAALVRGLGSAAMSKAKGAATKLVNAITSPFRKVGSFISGVVRKVGSLLSFSGLVGKVKGVFDKVKHAMFSPIEKARDKVKSIIDKIKGYFPFKIGNVMSGIKLPHFKITGSFSIRKKTVPHLSIDWYKKGGIFTEPTIFPEAGVGLGEAGPEAVLPLNPLWNRLDKIADNAHGNITNTFNITVDGAEDPEQFASRLVGRLKMEMRTV